MIKARERELESGLVDHVQKFLLELGAGFAFVGRQVPIAVGDDDFYLDLLFYHLKLRCFVVIDLKMQQFTPEDAGKLNFYLSAIDSQMQHPDDKPSIGLVLCKTRNRVIAEFTWLNAVLKDSANYNKQPKDVLATVRSNVAADPFLDDGYLKLAVREACESAGLI